MDIGPEKLKLISVLATTNIFLMRSTEDGWGAEKPDETAIAIESLISHLFKPQYHPLPQVWRILFAATGPVQEIAMQNDWHDIYMKLAAEFDTLAYLVKDKAPA